MTDTLSSLEARASDPRIHAFGVALEAMARLERLFDRSLREQSDISQTWFEALLRIERSGGWMSMSELASQVVLTSGGVTRLVDRLVESGYAERQPCPTDRRVQYVAITEAGRRILTEALEVHVRDLDEHFIGRMSDSEREVLVAVMDRLRTEPSETG